MEYILATDPGSNGYIVLLSVTDGVMRIEQSFPLDRFNKVDFTKLNSFIYRAAKLTKHCFIEEPFATHRGIGTGLLIQGINYGFIYGLLKSHFNHVEAFHPSTWQSALKLTGKYKDKITLQTAVNLVGLPALIPPRCRNPHDGLMDALLIGLYGMLNCVNPKKGLEL